MVFSKGNKVVLSRSIWSNGIHKQQSLDFYGNKTLQVDRFEEQADVSSEVTLFSDFDGFLDNKSCVLNKSTKYSTELFNKNDNCEINCLFKRRLSVLKRCQEIYLEYC